MNRTLKEIRRAIADSGMHPSDELKDLLALGDLCEERKSLFRQFAEDRLEPDEFITALKGYYQKLIQRLEPLSEHSGVRTEAGFMTEELIEMTEHLIQRIDD